MILLFNPPVPSGRGYTREGRCTQEAGVWGTQWPPLSLATAVAALRGDGRRVTLRDYPAAGLGMKALMDDLEALRPALAIWSTGTPTLGFDLGLARLVREHAPHAITAVIGTHVSVLPEEALAERSLDIVIHGEPEGIISDLARSMAKNASEEPGHAPKNGDGDAPRRITRARFAETRGISFRSAEGGAVVHNPGAPLMEPDAIPAPDWGDLNLDAYRLPLKGRRFLIVAPVRGCPWRCTFCTAPLYYGHRPRLRPIVRVADEIEDNITRFGVRDFFIWADTFTADRSYVSEFCRTILKRGVKISWTCNSRVDTIDEELLLLMKKAGLWMISYGIESANDAILGACKKGITAAQSRVAVETAHKIGIRTAGHFIFGLPGETHETMDETLAFALSLPLDIAQFYAAAPFPGTALYEEALEKGWLRPKEGSKDTSFSQSGAAMDLPGLSAREVDAFRRKAFRRFYLRPSAAARVLLMLEPGALSNLLSSVRRYRQWIRK